MPYARRARGSTSEFFLSGRDVPWWLAGTSMVATTFAADTPLAVTGFVAKNGIAGNWLWWNFVMSGMMTVFLYARLWRRAGVMTDIEFAERRFRVKGTDHAVDLFAVADIDRNSNPYGVEVHHFKQRRAGGHPLPR